jgi:hypothetical protein
MRLPALRTKPLEKRALDETKAGAYMEEVVRRAPEFAAAGSLSGFIIVQVVEKFGASTTRDHVIVIDCVNALFVDPLPKHDNLCAYPLKIDILQRVGIVGFNDARCVCWVNKRKYKCDDASNAFLLD